GAVGSHGRARSAGRRPARAGVPGLRARLAGGSRRWRLRPRRGRCARGPTARRGARAGPRVRLVRSRYPRAEYGPAPALPRAGLVMTDFLDRLVARTVELSAVRPRAAGRFGQGLWSDPAPARRQAQDPGGADDPATPPLPPAFESARLVSDPGRRRAVTRGSLAPPAPPRAGDEELLPLAAPEPATSSPRVVARHQASRGRRAAP